MKSHLEKKGLHPRNKHQSLYDFTVLIKSLPALKPFVSINKYDNLSIDFANPEAVKTLNRALLKYFYSIENWNIPDSYLCPPIPGRAEYIHHVADVLSLSNQGIVPRGKKIKVLDIGVGANCIYPIIGHQEYGWHFVGSDIDIVSIQAVKKNIASNIVLQAAIECRLQPSSKHIFKNIIQPEDYFDVTICNPPFHASQEEANKSTHRKLNNLGQKKSKMVLNFGGQNAELWTEGGEIKFISTMISESVQFKSQCFWFSTLVSKSENLEKIYALLKKNEAVEVKTIPIEIGNKKSRIVFWTFTSPTKH